MWLSIAVCSRVGRRIKRRKLFLTDSIFIENKNKVVKNLSMD